MSERRCKACGAKLSDDKDTRPNCSHNLMKFNRNDLMIAWLEADRTRARARARKKSSRKKAEETQHAEQVDHEGLPLEASWTTLSGAQRDLVQGLHFLEDGKDQSLIIDEILKQRMYLLKNKLSIDDVKTVLDCIESAKKIGFKIPWFLGFLQRLWNAGLFRSDVDAKKIEGMTVFLEKMKERGWRVEEIPDVLSMPFIKFTLPKLSPEQGETLNDLLRRLNLEGLSVDEHMKQVSEARNTLSWYKAVLDGRATMDQFRQAVNQQ